MTRIVAGKRSVLEAIRGGSPVHKIYLEARRHAPELYEAARKHGIEIEEVTRARLDEMSRGVRHQGVVATAGEYAYQELDAILEAAKSPPLLVALDQITDPQNLGAIIRSAVTFGLDGVLIQKHRAAAITPSVVRASAGATEHARVARVTNLQKTLVSLHDRGFEIIGLDAGGDADVEHLKGSTAGRVLVVGSEGEGLRRLVRQRCDLVVQIHQEGPMDSLNASVAAAIAMYQVARLRRGSDE